MTFLALIVSVVQASLITSQLDQVKTCKYKNGGKTYEINEGDVTEVKKTKVRVCENGKTILKKKEEVPLPYKYGCNGKKFLIR